MRDCPKVFEKIATGELPARIVYKNPEHGLYVFLDNKPAARGHLLVTTLVCRPEMDDIESPSLIGKIFNVSKHAGRLLRAEYNAPYRAGLLAGNEVPHPHFHRLPGDGEADWAKRFAHMEDSGYPRLQLSTAEMDDIHGRLIETGITTGIWQECDQDVASLGEPDQETIEAKLQLGIS